MRPIALTLLAALLASLALLQVVRADGGVETAAPPVGESSQWPGAEVAVLEVGPRSVACADDVPRRCFEARGTTEAEWEPFQGEIYGYTHREGHASVVLVRQVAAERFELVHEIATLPLGGGRWVLERHGTPVDMEGPLEGVDVWFEVAAGGALMIGSLGCNDFSAPLALDGDEVGIGPIASTLRACAEDVMVQERAVAMALVDADRVTFYGDAVGFAGEERRVRFGARPREARLTWTQGPDDPEIVSFREVVRGEAEAGASWVHDPVRVALAFIDSRGAARVDITRRDDRGESPTSTLVTVDEDGFLDDSVRGVRSEVVLAPAADGAWHVLAVTVATRCWRDDRMVVAPGEACP